MALLFCPVSTCLSLRSLVATNNLAVAVGRNISAIIMDLDPRSGGTRHYRQFTTSRGRLFYSMLAEFMFWILVLQNTPGE